MFKKVEHTKVVPASVTLESSVSVVEYVCGSSGCVHSTEDLEVAERHYLFQHAFSARQSYIAGYRALYFGSAELIDLYDKYYRQGSHCDELRLPVVKAPGWYVMETSSGPCGRGCCERSWETMIPLSDYESLLKSKLREVVGEIRSLRELRKRP